MSISTMSIAIIFDMVGICNEEFPSIKSPGSLITWSCNVKYTILAAVSILPQGLLATGTKHKASKLGKGLTYYCRKPLPRS